MSVRIRTNVLLFAATVAAAQGASAAVVFDSPDYVAAGSAAFVAPVATVTATSLTRPFADATPTSGYTGPQFFAGYTNVASTTVTGLGYNRQRVDHNAGVNYGGNDFINIQGASTGGGNTIPGSTTFSTAGVVFFPAAVSFPLGGVTVMARGAVRSDATAQTARFVVRSGSDYYVSAQTFTLANAINTFNLDFGGNLNFAPYDPTASINFDQASAVFAPLNLSSINGVGFYAENDSWTSPAAAVSNYTISSLNVGKLVVTVIPEPATLGVVGSLGLLLLRRRGC